MPSIMDFFRGNPNPAPAMPPASQPAPGNMTQNNVSTDPNNTTAPAANTDPNASPASPLDQFGDLWKPVANNNEPGAMFANVDPVKMMEAAKKTNFASLITKDQQNAIAQGGNVAVEAFMQAINSVGQQAFANSAMATTKIVDQALAKQMEQFKSLLPSLVKQHTLADNLRTTNPVFNHPSVQPLIKAMEHQLAQKHPNATAAELTQLAQEYVAGLGQAFNPTVNTNANSESTSKSDTDWSKFLEG